MLMARLNRKQSLRLLDVALDAGITHFDTARLYGYGEAEGVLGRFLGGRRSTVTVTTKLGILPPRRSPALSLAKGLARRVVSFSPHLRTAFRRKAEGMVQAGRFDVPTARQSLETSLRELRTDYIDYLLMHECKVKDLESPDLLRFVEDCQRQGKVLQFGVATTAEDTVGVVLHRKAFAQVIQFPNSLLDKNIEKIPQLEDSYVFTHSALGSTYKSLRQALADRELARQWSQNLGVDCSDGKCLADILLRYAMTVNPRGTILFSSTTEANIQRNAALHSATPLNSEQRTALEAVADTLQESSRAPLGACG